MMSKDKARSNEASVLAALSGSDPMDQRSAAFEAAELNMKEAVPRLAELICSSNLGVQEAAEGALLSIRGKEVVSQIIPLLRSDDASVRNSAMEILRRIGVDNIRALSALINDPDPDIRIFTADILGSVGTHLSLELLTHALLDDKEVNVRYQAAISLGMLGMSEAADSLRQVLNDDEEWVRFAAVEALTNIRAESCVDIFVQALPKSSPLLASTIVDALGEMKNFKAVPLLLRRLDESSGPLRNKEIKAIVQILGANSLVLLGEKDIAKLRPYLLAALKDSDKDVVASAMEGLSAIGDAKGTREVIALINRLDPVRDQKLLHAATQCIASIGLNGDLVKALSSSNETVVRAGIEALGNIDSERSANVLADAFWNLDRDMQRLAIDLLSQIATEEHIHFFETVLGKNSDAHVLQKALYFLGNTMHRVRSGPLLLNFLAHPYNDVKDVALEACLALNSPEVNAHLIGLGDSDDPVMRMMAVYSMGRIDCEANIAGLKKALHDPEPDIRKVALSALSANAAQVEDHLDLIAPLLKDENRLVRLAVVETISICATPGAINILFTALDDNDDWVKIRAAETLAGYGQTAAVPKLIDMLHHANPMVIFKVIEALSMIGGNAAFRALLDAATNNENQDVAQAAIDAVARIRREHREDD
jgi:HEAT repeat protein